MEWMHTIADGEGPITLATIVVSLAAFTGGLITWILQKLQKSVDRNSALIASLVEVQLVRAAQAATTDEMKDVVKMLRDHFTESKK